MKTRSGYGFLLLSALVYAVNVIDRQLLPLLAEVVRKDIALADWQLGLLTGLAFAVFYALCTLPLAWIADTGNRRNIVAGCLGLFSLATAACGFAHGFWHFLTARTAVAIGEAGTTPASLSMLGDRFPDRRGFASGALTAGGHLGILGGVLLAALLATSAGWRITFIVTGALGLVLTVIYLAAVREPTRLAPVEQRNFLLTMKTLWTHGSFRGATIALTGLLFFSNATGAWLPSFLARAHGLSTNQIALFIGLSAGLIGMVCVLTAGPLLDRLTRRDIRWLAWLPAVIIVVILTTTAVGLAVTNTPVALVLLSVAPATSLIVPACLFAMLQTAIPAGLRASATAVLFLIANLIGMGVGPTLVGALSSAWAATDSLSLRPALLVGIIPSITGLVGCLMMARSLPADVSKLGSAPAALPDGRP
jgi:MFS family permease